MHHSKITPALFVSIVVVLASFGIEKAEAKKPVAPQQEQQTQQLPESTLTPEQQEQLIINEDNVMEPFPG